MSPLGRLGLVPGLIAALFAIAGCGGQAGRVRTTYKDPHPLPPDTLTASMEQPGTYGGRFVIGATAAPKTFNGMLANESSSTDIAQELYVTLADYDNAEQKEIPGLAKSWDVSADGLTWTWHMRRGACFSDGVPITSDDVLFSFKLAMDEKLHPAIQDLLKPGGKPMDVSAPDSYTVVTKIAVPYALMVSAIGALRIMPRHVLGTVYEKGAYETAYSTATAPESLVTSGAWALKQYVPNDRTVLTRNPYWYGVDSKGQRLPYLDELVFLVVPDQNTAKLKFDAGELDALDNVKPEDYQDYADRQEKGKFTLYDLGPSLNTNCLWFNLNTIKEPKPGKAVGQPYVDRMKYGWFSQKAFRQAVSMAIDRGAITRSVMFGEGVNTWSTSTPANKLWYTPDVGGLDYNPEEAKKRLASLGWKDRDGDGFLEDNQGHTISFAIKTNGDNNLRMSMCNLVKDDLAKVGIKCQPTGVEFKSLVANLRDDFNYEAALLGTQTGTPPDPGMGQNVWRSSGPTHYWNVRQKSPATPEEARINSLMDACVGTTDMTERKRAWGEIQKIVNDQCWIVWLPVQRTKLPVRNGFGNVHPVGIPLRILWNITTVFKKPRSGA